MLNQVTLIGRLGADPEVRYMPDGKMVVNIRVATDENWKDKNGEKMTKTEWHRVVIFGKLAEIVAKYSNKGRLIYIEGRIQTRKWTDKDQIDRYTTEIIAMKFLMLDKAANGNGAANSNGFTSQSGDPGAGFDGSMPLSEEDVPF